MKVIRLKARAYESELIYGKIQLSDVYRRVRLDVLQRGIDIFPDTRKKANLQSLWEVYNDELTNKSTTDATAPFSKGIELVDGLAL